MPRPSYTEEQIQDMEERISAAALHVFGREGYRNFSLRAVAREMGLTAPALYRYVDNKDQLLAELRAEGFRRLGEIFRKVAESRARPLNKGREMLRAALDFAVDEPDLYRIMYELDQGEAPAPQWVRDDRQTTFDAALTIAEGFVAAGHVDIDPLDLVHLWWIGLHGLASLDLANQLDMGRSRDELVEPTVALMTNTNYLKTVKSEPARKPKG
ncbi:MAG: TetR/AcrR family transcriptional regulator [Gammaproteobacteria bacterium]|jgi:AcrR family transcriptional regulator|nr:TetR/AcrR family transcriptional regulator [Gammaproteobacteria bacterium]